MTVTVGIATTGENPQLLRETVDGVIRAASLVSADAEVLVVVNGRGRVAELDGIDSPLLRVRYLDQRGVGLARNTVLAEARHDTILFTDDDCQVPPEWCVQLVEALWQPGWAAIGAPVRLPVAGPVTAYFDYLRMYDAIAWGTDGPLLLVTANCGLRRDLIGRTIQFDACLGNAGAEDTAFALALGNAGLRAGWLADATPVRHPLSERIEEITDRFRRNASNAVHRYLDHGDAESAMPGILGYYRQRVQDDSPHERHFGEFVAAPARTAFAFYDALAAAATAIGYLDRLGTEVGHPLLELDLAALTRSWREIAGKVGQRADTLSPAQWATLEVDYPSMGHRLAEPEPLLAQLRQALRRYARPLEPDPDGPVRDLLDHGVSHASGSSVGRLASLRQAYDQLGAGRDLTPAAVEGLARAHGVSFKVALDAIELSFRFDIDGVAQEWRSRRRTIRERTNGVAV